MTKNGPICQSIYIYIYLSICLQSIIYQFSYFVISAIKQRTKSHEWKLRRSFYLGGVILEFRILKKDVDSNSEDMGHFTNERIKSKYLVWHKEWKVYAVSWQENCFWSGGGIRGRNVKFNWYPSRANTERVKNSTFYSLQQPRWETQSLVP